jgi:hypothetical protein
MEKNNRVIRASVRSFYDAQKLRIEIGNRLVANFYATLGHTPGEKLEAMESEAKKVLHKITIEYSLISEAVANKGIRAKVKYLRTHEGVINSPFEYELTHFYMSILDTEAELLKTIEYELENEPLWTNFLKKVKGCGPLMAAVIISEFDVHKAKYISSFWKYAGLDVVCTMKNIPLADAKKYFSGAEEFYVDGDILVVDGAPYSLGDNNTVLVPDWKGRSRRGEHLVNMKYQAKDGTEKERLSITFNPFLKTKLIGVLGTSFLRSGSQYAQVYYDYKNRLENHPKYKDVSKAHRHNMAIRYMIKMFLKDMWVFWRKAEGLEVTPSYAEAKLGIVHSNPVVLP